MACCRVSFRIALFKTLTTLITAVSMMPILFHLLKESKSHAILVRIKNTNQYVRQMHVGMYYFTHVSTEACSYCMINIQKNTNISAFLSTIGPYPAVTMSLSSLTLSAHTHTHTHTHIKGDIRTWHPM
jgi:hypothetical protein